MSLTPYAQMSNVKFLILLQILFNLSRLLVAHTSQVCSLNIFNESIITWRGMKKNIIISILIAIMLLVMYAYNLVIYDIISIELFFVIDVWYFEGIKKRPVMYSYHYVHLYHPLFASV